MEISNENMHFYIRASRVNKIITFYESRRSGPQSCHSRSQGPVLSLSRKTKRKDPGNKVANLPILTSVA